MKIPAFAIIAMGLLFLAGCTSEKRAKYMEACGGWQNIRCDEGLRCASWLNSSTGSACDVIYRNGQTGANDSKGNNSQIANPASANCIEKGGKLIIVDEEGGQVGYCTLANGSRCEEWEFFRSGKCEPPDASGVNGTGASPRENRQEGEFCGGIAGFQCASGLECKLDGDYPDAGGKCARAGQSDGGNRLMPMTQELCENGGGSWNECASACRNAPNATVCTLQCVQVCQCGGMPNPQTGKSGTCPSGWKCAYPVADELGECVPADNA